MALTGILLAAGAGVRAGGPKALRRSDEGVPWLALGVTLLEAAGCSPVVVVLGAAADEARALVPAGAIVVVNADWQQGMASSLRAGLRSATGDAAMVSLVDLPELPAEVAHRVLGVEPVDRTVLRRATYGGRPGHPVLIGADHWAAISDEVAGDHGARDYLSRQRAVEVECGDLSDGNDVDSQLA